MSARILKKIILTEHLRWRLDVRGIPVDMPKRIYEKSKERYDDALSGHKIAIMKVKLYDKDRLVALSYDEDIIEVRLITIHPIKLNQKLARVKFGRWRKI